MRRMFRADLGDALRLDPDLLQALPHHCLQRGFIVNLRGEAGVPQPLHILGDQTDNVLVLANGVVVDAV